MYLSPWHSGILKFFSAPILFVTDAISTSAMGGCTIDLRTEHHLSAQFAKLLKTLGQLLNDCTDVNDLKAFLQLYSHPHYPDKPYIEPKEYCDAQTAEGIIFCLFPSYINYMERYLLEQIVDEYGTHVCKECFQNYELLFQRTVRKLRGHPAPLTDNEIEQVRGQKKKKVSVSGSVDETTPQSVQSVQKAIKETTGINQAGQSFAFQDEGNSVIFTFLVPDCAVHLFHEFCDYDLTLLAKANITKIQVEEMETSDTEMYTIKVKKVQRITSCAAPTTKRQAKPSSLEYYINKRQDCSIQQRSDLISMVKRISDIQLNEVCSDELLLEVSSFIVDWRRIAPYLGLQEFYYNIFIARSPNKVDQNYELLLFWKRKEREHAIYYHMLQTFILHGTTEEVKKIMEIQLTG